jgi:hypothetical protein
MPRLGKVPLKQDFIVCEWFSRFTLSSRQLICKVFKRVWYTHALAAAAVSWFNQ